MIRQNLILLFIVFYSNNIFASKKIQPAAIKIKKNSAITIRIKKSGIHSEDRERNFLLTVGENQSVSGKIIEKKVARKFSSLRYTSLISTIIKSPILQKTYQSRESKLSCLAETIFEIRVDDFNQSYKLCENPNALIKEEKVVLNWANFLLNN